MSESVPLSSRGSRGRTWIARASAFLAAVCLLTACSAPASAPAVPSPVPAQAQPSPALQPTMVPESKPLDPSQTMLERARADAASRAGVPAPQVDVLQVEQREWSDRGLGCPEPGMMYAQVITPGYLIVLEARGNRYEYHTDETNKLVLCENGRPA